MELALYYTFTLFVLIVTVWQLWRQGRIHSRFARALYVLVGLQLVGILLTGTPLASLPGVWPMMVLQIAAWGCLLWGLRVPWHFTLRLAALTAVALLFPVFPTQQLLTWGLVTAVPLAAVADLRQRVSFPVFAATSMSQHLRPVGSDGHITAEMVMSEQPILECLVDGVLICGPGGTIYSVNQAAIAILGMVENKLVGRPISDILAHFPVLGELKQGMKERRFEINGRTVEGQMNLIYDLEGGAQGAVVILRDITTEYQSEVARDNFLTTVSHELRTPLTAIKGYVELMQAGAGGELNVQQEVFMRIVQRNVSRMVQLINSLLFAASVRGGRMEARTGQANIPQIIHQVVREMSPAAAKSGQSIQPDVDSRLHWVEADPIHITMVVEELVSNAIKYGRDGGEVQVMAVLESDEFVVVTVADQGIGIAPEDQAHIFEDFFRPEWRQEHVHTGGIGMGLSVVHALIEAYNGRIWFESVSNQGTAFTFILPVRQPARPELTIPQPLPH